MTKKPRFDPSLVPIVQISWLDASFDSDGAGNKPVEARTVGFLVELTDDYVKVSHEIFKDGDARGTTAIPGGMVKEIKVMVKRGLPEGWPRPELK